MSDERKNAPAGGEKRMNSEKKTAFGGKTGANSAGKPAFGGNGRANSGFHGKTGDKKPAFGGASGEKRPFRGDKPAFGGEKSANPAEKRPFRGPRVEANGEKGAFRTAKPGFGGNRPANPDRSRSLGGDQRPEKRRPEQQEGLATRRMALEVIREVTENGAYINQVLDDKLRDCGLSAVDRRLVARLAYDTIENQMKLDWALNQIMAKPDTDIKLRNVLRLGACQILLEDRIPDSAATNTSVVLCKEIGMEGLAGVCNGILRNLIRQKDELTWPDPETEPVKAKSIRYSVPEWLVERLTADWGDESDEIMGYHEQETSVTLRPNMTRHTDASFEALLNKKVWEHEKGDVSFAWKVRNMVDIGRDAGFVGGDYSIQSESSMMACLAVSPKRGATVLDCCAAPGGKSCLLAEMMGGSGRVQAWEIHAHRTDLIAAQAKRLSLDNVRPMTRDASIHRDDCVQAMDAVLLDAPCSGLGVMAGKPDVKYRVSEESVAELTALQEKILETVSAYVKKGGVLVYSTCSVLKDENENQVKKFLQKHPEFEVDALPETIPEKFRCHADVGLQLLPHRDHVEGFYICRMRRKRV